MSRSAMPGRLEKAEKSSITSSLQSEFASGTVSQPGDEEELGAGDETSNREGRLAYSQMPMRAFMSNKDWRELITRRNAGKLAKCKESGNKYNRMLYSYNRLYQEYQYLCTCLLPRFGFSLADTSSAERKVEKCAERKVEKCAERKVEKCADFGLNVKKMPAATSSDNFKEDEETAAVAASVCATSTAAAGAVGAQMEVPHADVFGSVLMSDRNFQIQRVKKRRNTVSHRVLTRSADGNAVWMDVPIAVELLLPRLQEQIRIVMSVCPHVSDPLEVLAELRANRYDTERCVEYLQETMPLREVVRDMLSVRSGRVLEAAKAAADRRDLCCRIVKLENKLRAAAAQLLLDGSVGEGKSDAAGGGRGGSGADGSGGGGGVGVGSGEGVKEGCDANAVSASNDANQSQSEKDLSERPLIQGFHQLKDDLKIVRSSLESVTAAVTSGLMKLRYHLVTQQYRCRRCKKGDSLHQATVARLQKCIEDLRVKCKEEEARRRTVFNALQEQLGNIRVYCRCMRIEGEQAVETVGAESVRVRCQLKDEFFRFDRVFGPDEPQEALFEELQPLITSFLDGYNVSFITYGGEASGKTFTLLGTSKQRGLVYRALVSVLQESAHRESDWHIELDSACLEIYNDACFDLLAERSSVNVYKECDLSSVFSHLQRVPIREVSDVANLLRACSARRRVAKTALNPKSSRSHLVHLVRLQAKSRVHGHTTCSYLGMMDLAGAENIVKADTLHEPERTAEAGHINRSLAAFNRLILMLRRTPPNAVCYREARLTQMLKPFLVNHGKCCIIVTVRTDQASASTTMSTMRFGRDARQVALGKAQRQLLNYE